MDDSVIKCDEIIESNNEETKTVPKNLKKKKKKKKKVPCKTQNFYILFTFL